MGSSVSQLQFWKEGHTENSSEDNEGATYLSYNIFMVLSILGGIIGLDHLYIRSPTTFLAKMVVNMMFFGVWWIYDASLAIFNKDVIKVFGISIPGLGPKGIAAGVLSKDAPDKKHWNFFIYGLAVVFGGIFGMDSFVLGDNESGMIRLIAMISVIGMPIAVIWWLSQAYSFIFDTETVVGENSEYFGGVFNFELSSKLNKQFPFLTYIFWPLRILKTMVNNVIMPILKPIIDPIANTINKVSSTVDGVVALGRESLEKGTEIVTSIKDTVQTAVQAAPIVPGASLYSSITPAEAQAMKLQIEKDGIPMKKGLDIKNDALFGFAKRHASLAAEKGRIALDSAKEGATQLMEQGRKGFDSAKEGFDSAKQFASQGASELTQKSKQFMDSATSFSSMIPSASSPVTNAIKSAATSAATSAAQTVDAAKSATEATSAIDAAKMAGGALVMGNSLNIVPYTLLATILIISVAGFALTYYRAKQDVKQQEPDDSPPEPGVFRKPDPKGGRA